MSIDRSHTLNLPHVLARLPVHRGMSRHQSESAGRRGINHHRHHRSRQQQRHHHHIHSGRSERGSASHSLSPPDPALQPHHPPRHESHRLVSHICCCCQPYQVRDDDNPVGLHSTHTPPRRPTNNACSVGLWNFKNRERNFIAAWCHCIVFATLCGALIVPRWFHMINAPCTKEYIGLKDFYETGNRFHNLTKKIRKNEINEFGLLVRRFTLSPIPCVTEYVVSLMRAVTFFCTLALITTALAFLMDNCGVNNKTLKCIRRNAVLSVLTVLLDDLYAGVPELLLPSDGPWPVGHVEFDIGFYLVAAAGGMAVVAAAVNLLRRWPSQSESHDGGLEGDGDPLLLTPQWGDDEGGEWEDEPPLGHFYVRGPPPPREPPPPYTPT